jgi:sulfur carrier protein
MNITVNGEAHEVPNELTLLKLLEHLGLRSAHVAVEQNREIVPRAEHPERRVAPGDTFEIVHFVGGG